MRSYISVIRLCRVVTTALILIAAASGAGYSQQSTPPRDISGFFRDIIGEWIGTVEQYTGGVKADTKYFHAVARQAGPDTYEAVFEYYRIDKKTHAPVRVGVTSMVNKIAPDGTATNTITGKGDVFVDPQTQRPEEHQLSEVLRMSPSGSLEGTGSGRISVSGIALGAGKGGKVSNYTSTWSLNNGVLSISERLRVTFHVLFFATHYDIVDDFAARRGSDVMGLMRSAGSSASPTSTTRSPGPSPAAPAP